MVDGRQCDQQGCYLETESELSCGSPDFDLITEVSDAVCEPGCGFGRVATGEVFGAEVLVVSAVTQHVVDRRQDRRRCRSLYLLELEDIGGVVRIPEKSY